MTLFKRSDHLITKIFLWTGGLFFLAEFFLHFFGLEPLEHDTIFIPTHDRYIAAYALTMAGLSFLITRDMKKYRELFVFTMLAMLLGFFIGTLISFEGGYSALFPVVDLDQLLGGLGTLFLIWYLSTWYSWFKYL